MLHAVNVLFAGGFTFLVVLAVVSDVRQLVIPNWISLALVGAFAAYAAFAAPALPVLAHIGVAVAVFAVGIVLFVLRWSAAGDGEALAAVALWAGSSASLWLAVLTTSLGALLAIGVLGARWLDAYGEAIGMPSGMRRFLPRWARHGLRPYGGDRRRQRVAADRAGANAVSRSHSAASRITAACGDRRPHETDVAAQIVELVGKQLSGTRMRRTAASMRSISPRCAAISSGCAGVIEAALEQLELVIPVEQAAPNAPRVQDRHELHQREYDRQHRDYEQQCLRAVRVGERRE